MKAKQGYKLQTFDEKELIITQGNKVYTERLNSSIVALEMDELVNTRKLTEDIDRRHNRTNRLITAFSIAAVILLIII